MLLHWKICAIVILCFWHIISNICSLDIFLIFWFNFTTHPISKIAFFKAICFGSLAAGAWIVWVSARQKNSFCVLHLDEVYDGVDTYVMHIRTIARVRILCDMRRRIFQCGLPALLTNAYRINHPHSTLENSPTKMIQGLSSYENIDPAWSPINFFPQFFCQKLSPQFC